MWHIHKVRPETRDFRSESSSKTGHPTIGSDRSFETRDLAFGSNPSSETSDSVKSKCDPRSPAFKWLVFQ